VVEVLEDRTVLSALAPAFTSPTSTTFTVGTVGSFGVTTTHSSIPSLSETGSLPGGVGFVDNGDGTGTLSGNPNAGTGGVYNIAFDAHTVGYHFDVTTSYQYTVSEESGFLTITNNGTSTFTGSIGLYNGSTAIALQSNVTLNPGDSNTPLQAGEDSSDVGGFNLNGSNPSNGLQIIITGTVSQNAATEGVNLSVYDKDIHSGVFQTNPFGLVMDSYVLEGGDPYGRSTGHLYEVAQAPGHYSFVESAPPAAVGYQFDLTTSYQFYGNAGEETGFLTVTNNGTSTFTGTIGLYNGSTAIALQNSVTLNPGDTSLPLQAGEDASDMGGFNLNPGAASNGLQIVMTGTVTQGSASEAVNLSVYDKDIHSGSFQTNPFNVFLDNYVLEGSDPFGNNPGHVYETSQASGHYTFAEIAPDVTQNFTLTVNEAPSITSPNSTTFQVGSPGTFKITTGHSYPSPDALSETGALPSGVSFVDNGDGTATLSGTPDVGTEGPYTLTITASNGVSPNATQTFTLNVSPLNPGTIQVLRDPCDPSQKALVINGTANADEIRVGLVDHGTKIEVRMVSSSVSIKQDVPLNQVDRLIIYGLGGNDNIAVDDAVKLPALIFGGSGDNHIQAGGGPTVMVGGSGNDTLVGGLADDILIGGGGSDHLSGRGGNDILIAGTTAYDKNLMALCTIMDLWQTTTNANFAANMATLESASFAYQLNATTVHDDGAGNSLDAGSALDWLFANTTGVGNNGVKDHVNAPHRDPITQITL
jgi:hypothetical protein